MFNFFNKKPKSDNSQLTTVNLSLTGMHCSSCAVNIDLTLEDLAGVLDSHTNYAQSISRIKLDPTKLKVDDLIKEVEKLGYSATLVS